MGTQSNDEGEQAQQEALIRYLRDLSQVPLLSRTQEVELAKRMEGGDREALERFTLANRRLVVSIAKRYMGRGLSLLDLIQHGNAALVDAVPRYDWRRGDQFASYAAGWIDEALRGALSDRDQGSES